MKKIVLFVFLTVFLYSGLGAFAQDYILFYGNGCPHCAKVEQYIKSNKLEDKFDIKLKEIYFNKNNLLQLQEYLDKLQLESSQIWVPFLVINNPNECTYINWSTPIIDFFQQKIDIIENMSWDSSACNTNVCVGLQCEWQTLENIQDTTNWSIPVSKSIENDQDLDWVSLTWDKDNVDWELISWGISSNEKKSNINKWRFFGIMLPAALSDSINPCAFAVILLLISSILTKSKSKRKALLAWWLFVLAVFISYFAMWLGLFTALASSTNTYVIKIIVWVLWILVWLANLKDVFWYGKWFVMEVPFSWRPKMISLIEKIVSPMWAFIIWFFVSLFLLPCTSWPYFTILGYLASESKELHTWGYIYLLVYNLIFVLPMIVIALLVAFGFKSAEELAAIKKKNTRLIHLIVGLLMLGLGIYVLLTM